jgi:hypothetical protein
MRAAVLLMFLWAGEASSLWKPDTLGAESSVTDSDLDGVEVRFAVYALPIFRPRY